MTPRTLRGMPAQYGLDPRQFAFRIVRPLLLDIGLWSPIAGPLVLGTGMQESHLRFMQQIRGPAIGIYQMEPATYADLRANFLAYQPELRRAVDDWVIGEPDVEEMEGNLYFATAMCRVHYRRIREALPSFASPFLLAQYWKRYYNTPLGSGTIEQARPHFERAIEIFNEGATS